MQYRPEIDGVRAIAVGGVILFHAAPALLPGGFLGVDVFFVLSGFLITGILAHEVAQGQFSYRHFLLRRARRILPALFFMLTLCVPVAWMLMLPEELERFGRSLGATLAFASNIFMWREAGYFAPDAHFLPLLHTWSLAVEEQFYLLYPVLFVALSLWAARLRGVILFAGALVSLALAEFLVLARPDAAFYLMPTRGWELLVGACVALWMRHNPKPHCPLCGWIGLGLVLGSFWGLSEAVPMPSLWALFPVIGTALILLFAEDGRGVGRVLAARPMVGLGLISYAAYLWHQPVFVFARLADDGPLGGGAIVVLILLSFTFAALSWRFIEEPARRKMATGRLLLVLGGGVCLLGGVAALFVLRAGMPERLPGAASQLLAQARQVDPRIARCAAMVSDFAPMPDPLRPECRFGPAGGRPIALIGDSHAEALATGLLPALIARGIPVIFAAYPGCPPFAGYRKAGFACETIPARLRTALEQAGVRQVVLAVRSTPLTHARPFDNGLGGAERTPFRPVRFDAGLDGAQVILNGLARWREEFDVLMVAPVPEAGWTVPVFAARRTLWGAEMPRDLTVPRASYEARSGALRARLTPPVLDSAARFCDAQNCTLIADGVSLYRDDDHLSRAGADRLVPDILAWIAAPGRLRTAPAPLYDADN